jgi:hypothetical protein
MQKGHDRPQESAVPADKLCWQVAVLILKSAQASRKAQEQLNRRE